MQTLTIQVFRKAVQHAKYGNTRAERRAACSYLAGYAARAGDFRTAALYRAQARYIREGYYDGLAMCADIVSRSARGL